MELPAAPEGRRRTPTLGSWVRTCLGNVLDVIRGVSYEKQDSRDAPADGLVPILRATNIGAGLNFDDLVYVPSANVSAEQRLRRGDSVIAASSGSRSVVGKAAMLAVPWHGSFGAFCFALRPRTVIEPGFLSLFLQTSTYRNRVSELAAGVNINNLRRNHIEETPLLLPPKEEQRRIVDEVEKQFTRLDAAVAGLQRVKANLKRYRASVLKAGCEGRLVPTEAELARREGRSFESGEELLKRILRKHRAAAKSPPTTRKPQILRRRELEQTEDLGLVQIPSGWTRATVELLAQDEPGAILAGPFGTIFKAKDFRPSGVPIIFLRHVAPGRYLTHKPGYMDASVWERLFRPYSVYGGELLVTKLGEPPGTCAIYPSGIGPAMVTPDVMKMTVDPEAASSRFLMYYFNSEVARRLNAASAFGTTRLRLTLPLFRALSVPLPPLTEQHRIVAEVERRLSVIDELEATVEKDLARCARLRQSIMKMAFEGRLVPQDPNDEPASILLERIRKERAQGKPQVHRAKAGSGARKRRRRSGL